MKNLILIVFGLMVFVCAIALHNAFIGIGIPNWGILMASGAIAFAAWRYPRKVDVDGGAAKAKVGHRESPNPLQMKSLEEEVASLRKKLGLREKLIKELQQDRNWQRRRREEAEERYQRECLESERKLVVPSVEALFMEHVRDAVFLIHERQELGQSKSSYGGLPRLPDGVEWPRGARSPYHFLASIHLE